MRITAVSGMRNWSFRAKLRELSIHVRRQLSWPVILIVAEHQQYRYDTINVYFRDEFYVEHKAITERVILRASGALVHANYDFEVQCHNQLDCANIEIMTEAVLWAFRNAIVENRLYEIIYEPCDPRGC